MRRRQDNVSGL